MSEPVGRAEITEILHASLGRQFAELVISEDGSAAACLDNELPGIAPRARLDLLGTIVTTMAQFQEEEEEMDDAIRAALAVSILSIGYQLGREVQRREDDQ